MNNKTLLVAGISALAISALGVSGLVSAANTSTTKSQSFKGGMRGMKRGEFGLGRGQGFGGDHGGKGMFGGMQNSAIKAAIDANDYNAFITARKADTNKPSDATQPTQEQFNQIVSQSKKQAAVESALKANDYDAYVKATTPTKEEFAQQVAHYNTRTAIETAIKANDYNAFKTAWGSDTNKPSDATVPTQSEFTKMVERFTAKSTTTSNQ